MRIPLRSLYLLLTVVLIAACGPEAPARLRQADPRPEQPAATPLIQADGQPLLSDQNPNPRGLGDPRAPIVVIEYSDYQ